MKCRANGANGLPIIVALMASVHANRPWQSRPAVPAMRCSGSCYKANGAAGRIAAALVLMRATRLSPGRTQAAAEPTARPTAGAVSTDSNENGRICVGGLGPDAGSVWRHRERQLPAALCHSHAPRASRAVRSRWREWAADCRPYGLDARRSAAAPKGGLATSRAPPVACCSEPLACSACITCSVEPLA